MSKSIEELSDSELQFEHEILEGRINLSRRIPYLNEEPAGLYRMQKRQMRIEKEIRKRTLK